MKTEIYIEKGKKENDRAKKKMQYKQSDKVRDTDTTEMMLSETKSEKISERINGKREKETWRERG